MSKRAALLAFVLVASQVRSQAPHGFAPVPSAPNCNIFPIDNVWNVDISGLPVDPNSANIINAIGANTGLHPDFGSFAGYGIPFNVVSGSTPRSSVQFTYASESDAGPYPIPANYLIEGNDPASCNSGNGGDCHVLLVDKDSCTLYELFALQQNLDGSFSAGSGAIWNLDSNALRPDTWTSADAAGLPILPGLARYDEVASGVIDHAFRFTVPHTKNAHIYPARHDAGSSSYLPPMGMRVRLKASVDISGFTPQAKVVLTALKKYGMLLADNGSAWYISGASDPNFDDSDLHNLGQIHGSDLEVVNTSSLVNGPDPDFTIGLSNPALGPVFPGQTATFNGNLTAIGGYNHAVALACTGTAPEGCSASPGNPIPSTPFSVTASSVTPQDYSFAITGTGSDAHQLKHSQKATLHVVDFGLASFSGTTLTSYPGTTTPAITFQVTAAGSFGLPVNLSCSGLPIGATCNFMPSATVFPTSAGAANTSLTVTLPANAGFSDTQITIDATTSNPAATRTHNLVLSVVGFWLTAPNPASVTVAQANTSAPLLFSVQSLGSFSALIALTCSGLPAGAGACSFYPSANVTPVPGLPAAVALIVDSGTAGVSTSIVTITASSAGAPAPKTTTFQLSIVAGSGTADLKAAISHPTIDPLMVGGTSKFHATISDVASSASLTGALAITFSDRVLIGTLPTGCAQQGNAIACSTTTQLSSGQSQAFDIPVTVPFIHSVTATAIASSTATESKPADNQATDFLKVRPRPLARH